MLSVRGNNPLHFAYDVGEQSVLTVRGRVGKGSSRHSVGVERKKNESIEFSM